VTKMMVLLGRGLPEGKVSNLLSMSICGEIS